MAQFIANPNPIYWMALKCILWYLKETQNFGLYYSSSYSTSLPQLNGWSNANYAGDLNAQKSTFRYFFLPQLISFELAF